jgi:hypothetical protein
VRRLTKKRRVALCSSGMLTCGDDEPYDLSTINVGHYKRRGNTPFG